MGCIFSVVTMQQDQISLAKIVKQGEYKVHRQPKNTNIHRKNH